MSPLDHSSFSPEADPTLFPLDTGTASSPDPGSRLSSAARRLVQDRPEILDEFELVTLLLSGHRPLDEAEALAAGLLSAFHDAARILAAPPGRLRSVPGIDNAAIAAIKTAESLAIRHSAARLPGTVNPMLKDYHAVVAHCRSLIACKPHEELHVLYLDTKNRPIACELHRAGTVNHVAAHPRDIIARALELGATALILAHNHPSGSAEPSAADVKLTRKIKAGAACLDIKVLDHIVITPQEHFSFAHKGLI